VSGLFWWGRRHAGPEKDNYRAAWATRVAQEKGSGRPTRMVEVCFDRQTWDLAVVWGI
jgi:hypothetical protein